ncbi:MAG TPA: hypothetical protein VFG67_09635 [Oleiagrimonas sp.]|nr:hypothetical protein [Oleiagrimonas sp.]
MLSYKQQRQRDKLRKQLKKNGFRRYPVVTVAFYGPDDQHATKAVASLIRHESGDIEAMEKWYAEDGDIRHDRSINAQMLASFAEAHPKSIVKPDRIIGCPHEEGIDYPEGESCPECPFWKNRNRFTGQIEH